MSRCWWQRATRPKPVLAVVAVASSVVLWWSVTEGRRQQHDHDGMMLGAAPLVGRNSADGWDWRFHWVAPLLILSVILLAWSVWRGWWTRWSTLAVLGGAAGGSMLFGVGLALVDGVDGLTYGAEHPTEYLENIERMPPVGEFVRTFVDRIDDYTVHARGHPPAFLVQLRLMDRIGLGGIWPLVVVTVLAVGLTAVAVLWVVRRVVGDTWMRHAAPLMVVAPFLIWMVTSGDAVFTAVGAVGSALVAEAVHRRGRAGVVLGLVGGAVLAWLMFLTYLGGLFLAVPAAIVAAAMVRGRPRPWLPLLAAIAGGVVVIGAWAMAGFWWFDGVDITTREYHEGTAQFREWYYFRVGNLGAALMALGPAFVVGVAWVRERRAWWVLGGAGVALLASHLSTFTKAEVERIWLPFYPFLLVAAAGVAATVAAPSTASSTALPRRCVPVALALVVAAQGVYAVVLQSALVTKW